jgi:hypothetical protein
VEIQWQAELEQHIAIIERARQIYDRRQQEEIEDNDIMLNHTSDSDSELLVLGSSLFNGMEGIEIGGGIEVGGGIDVGGDDKVLGIISGSRIITSPRTTRSGKVIGE